MPSTRLLSSLLALILLASCGSSGDTSPVVASVYGRELHLSTLQEVLPQGLSPEDSTTAADNYIDQWIRHNVILVKAEKNVSDDFARELKQYKDDLVTYAYERQIIDQLLDTNVADSEIEEYYHSHSADFLLKNSIVKSVYVCAPVKSLAVGRLKNVISRRPFSDNDIMELEETASRHGLSGFYDASVWIPFYTLQATVPVTTYNESLFLKNNNVIILSDDSMFYAARIIDYRVTDQIAPLDTERENIRAIIINHRKIDILNRLHSDLLANAEKGGHIKKMKIEN